VTRRAVAWAFYDWANSAFPTVVSTFVIAAYFTQAVAPDPATGQALWGWMQSAVGLVVALASPLLGAIADRAGRRRALLVAFTLATAVATAAIWFVEPDPAFVVMALVLVGVASIGFELGTVFYNAMLPQVATPATMGRVSGLAWGLGYMGGLACLGLALVVLVQPDPALFGLDRGQAEHVRAVALLVALWIVAFSWPALVFLPDLPMEGPRPRLREALRQGSEEIVGVLRRLPRNPPLLRFMVARLFYTDGLNMLFAFGAIFAAGVFGMTIEEILLFGIALNVTAGAGAAGFAMIEDRVGSKSVIVLALAALVVLGAALLMAEGKAAFWVLALALGLFIGPAQAASRTLMARMAPPAEIGAYFGLFALSGRITGFLGPAVLATVTAVTASQRAGMAVILVFLGIGLAVLLAVREPPRVSR
jgi:UMF1 family MFS transporter